MGLKKKVTEIAISSAEQAIRTIAPALIQQITQSNGTFVGKIVKALDNNQFVVKDQMGNEQTITYIGDRALASGAGIVVNGGFGH